MDEILLSEVLSRADSFWGELALYIAEDEVWNLSSPCMAADPNELDDPDQIVNTDGRRFQYALQMATVQQIVKNVQAQTQNPPLSLLLEAFLYYYDNDAFIRLSG